MKSISNKGLDLIKSFEGLRLTAYKDGGGVPTIGYGHTRGVQMGDKITKKEADAFLRGDVQDAEAAVNESVQVPLEQSQFDALVSLAFNIGVRAFKNSTLVKRLNSRDYFGAAQQFTRWCYDNGHFVQGLKNRRIAEMKLFNGEVD